MSYEIIDLLPEPLRPYSSLIVGAVLAVAIFVVGWILSKWTHRLSLRMARRAKMDEALARFLAAIAQYAVLTVAVIAALGKVGIQTTSLVALLGAAGLAVGLALHGNLSPTRPVSKFHSTRSCCVSPSRQASSSRQRSPE